MNRDNRMKFASGYVYYQWEIEKLREIVDEARKRQAQMISNGDIHFRPTSSEREASRLLGVVYW